MRLWTHKNWLIAARQLRKVWKAYQRLEKPIFGSLQRRHRAHGKGRVLHQTEAEFVTTSKVFGARAISSISRLCEPFISEFEVQVGIASRDCYSAFQRSQLHLILNRYRHIRENRDVAIGIGRSDLNDVVTVRECGGV